jgi:regulatory protein
VGRERNKKAGPPLDEEGLERLCLSYAGRYATTRAKLASYLSRKLRERGWAGSGAAPVDRLVERCADLGYVDDSAFAASRAAALMRRGYGERRVAQALRAAGIEGEDCEPARAQAKEGAWAAALRFATRKRIGPFAVSAPDREGRQKAIAAMLRAGHDLSIVRRLLDVPLGEIPDSGMD